MDLLEPSLVFTLYTASLMPVSFQRCLDAYVSPSRKAACFSIVSSAHLLAGDPSRPPTGRIPHSISRLGSVGGSLCLPWLLGAWKGWKRPPPPKVLTVPQLHLFLPSMAGTSVNQPTAATVILSPRLHGLKAHPPLRCHAKIAIVNTRLLWLFIGPSSEFLIQ